MKLIIIKNKPIISGPRFCGQLLSTVCWSQPRKEGSRRPPQLVAGATWGGRRNRSLLPFFPLAQDINHLAPTEYKVRTSEAFRGPASQNLLAAHRTGAVRGGKGGSPLWPRFACITLVASSHQHLWLPARLPASAGPFLSFILVSGNSEDHIGRKPGAVKQPDSLGPKRPVSKCFGAHGGLEGSQKKDRGLCSLGGPPGPQMVWAGRQVLGRLSGVAGSPAAWGACSEGVSALQPPSWKPLQRRPSLLPPSTGSTSILSCRPVKADPQGGGTGSGGNGGYLEAEENSAQGREELHHVLLSPTLRYAGLEPFATKVQ